MSAVVVFTLIPFAFAALFSVVVIMGLAGKGRSRHPKVARAFARLAQSLNGEAELPRRVVRILS